MENLFIFLPVVILGVFIFNFVRGHKRLDIEQGQEPVYTLIAAGEIGEIRYQGPFISLRIYDEFLVVGHFKTLVLRLNEIESVELNKWNWISRFPDSIKINHHNPDVPSNLVLGTLQPERVKALIDARLQKRIQA